MIGISFIEIKLLRLGMQNLKTEHYKCQACWKS